MKIGAKGFSLVEALIAAGTLAVIVLMIAPQLTKKKEYLTKLQSFSSCDAVANFLLSNVTSRKHSVPVRNYFPVTGALRADATVFPDDLFCNTGRSPQICDLYDHFSPNGGTPEFKNYQNIRSSATWASYWFDKPGTRPAGSCTAEFNFTAANDFAIPGTVSLKDFLPTQLDAGEFATFVNDVKSDRQIDRVNLKITQLRDNGPLANCNSGSLLRPNNNYSFNIKAQIDYRQKDLRGPAGAGSAGSCTSDMNVSYGYDHEPAAPGYTLTHSSTALPGLPLVPAGTPPPPGANTCNPLPGPTGTIVNSSDARIAQVQFTNLEAGSVAICQTKVTDLVTGVPGGWSPWDLCQKADLAGITPSFVKSNPNNSIWNFTLLWGVPGGADPLLLPLGKQYEIKMRAVDTAGNCGDVTVGCLTELYISFTVNPFCTVTNLVLYCPGNVVIPTGCGTTCTQTGIKDFSANCPDYPGQPDSYFACEDRCTTCTDPTTGPPPLLPPYTPSCVRDLATPRIGTKTFAVVPGDGFCPQPNTYCASTAVQQVPCGGPCPAGTRDDSAGLCPASQDVCGHYGTRTDCTGPGGTRAPADPPEGSPGGDGCLPQYCPPVNTYCANTRMNDQCGNPCPEGAKATNCCDRCPSGSQQYESTLDCLSPTNYPSGPVPTSCSKITYGAAGTGQGNCFIPNP